MLNRREIWCMIEKGADGMMADYMAVPEVNLRLLKYFGASGERELLDALDCDFYYLSARDISQNESAQKCWRRAEPLDGPVRVCPLGIAFRRGAYGAKFAVDEAISAPLGTAKSPADILAYPLPRASDFDFSMLAEEAAENWDRIVVGGLWTGIMGDAYRLYGFERFLTDAALRPEMVKTLVNRLTDFYLEMNARYFEAVRGRMDVWYFGNDFGSQMGPLMSEEMWAGFFEENIRRLCDLAREKGLTPMMHSCGGIRPYIPRLIRAGVKLLDPIQTTARGMDAEALGRDFPALIFHGGLDTQRILPRGTPREVEREAERLSGAFRRYVFAPSQVLNSDVPTENIVSAYRAASREKARRQALAQAAETSAAQGGSAAP